MSSMIRSVPLWSGRDGIACVAGRTSMTRHAGPDAPAITVNCGGRRIRMCGTVRPTSSNYAAVGPRAAMGGSTSMWPRRSGWGLIVPFGADPRDVPVLDWEGRWLRLNMDGTATPLTQTEIILLRTKGNQ